MTRCAPALLLGLLAAAACTPTVRVEPPREPIHIKLDVHITQEVRVRVEKDVETLFEENDSLF